MPLFTSFLFTLSQTATPLEISALTRATSNNSPLIPIFIVLSFTPPCNNLKSVLSSTLRSIWKPAEISVRPAPLFSTTILSFTFSSSTKRSICFVSPVTLIFPIIFKSPTISTLLALTSVNNECPATLKFCDTSIFNALTSVNNECPATLKFCDTSIFAVLRS